MGITMAEPPPRARPDDSTGGSHVTIRPRWAALAALPTATGTPTAGSSPTTTGQSVAVELWAGADNLPVKSSTNAAGYPGEFRFSRWGEPVTITAPDPSQVEELSGAEPRSTR